MTRRITLLLILSLTLVAFMAMAAFAAKSPTEKRVKETNVHKLLQYAFPYPDESIGYNTGSSAPKGSLGRVAAASPNYDQSPGVKVGDTWYDYQRNGSMGRMIDVGQHDDEGTIIPGVHFSWMYLPGPEMVDRRFYYNYYDADAGVTSSADVVSNDYSGYVGIDVTGDNRACVGGHEKRGGVKYHSKFYWDADPMGKYFGDYASGVDDSVQVWGGSPTQYLIWPRFRYQETTPDTVLHVIAQMSSDAMAAADPQSIYYFRKVGVNADGEWDYPPLVIDTIFDLSQDVACSNVTGKVALVWTANLVNGDGAANAGKEYPNCDINSGEANYVQLDNDVYFMISNNQGASWETRKNVTCNVDTEAGYRPYTDLNALITGDENLHILYSGRIWPADANTGGDLLLACRLFHWSEDIPVPRTVHNAVWDQTTCNGGAWQMNLSKMSLSECDGRLYAMFVMFNDIPNGIEDDCAARKGAGSANGELWISVSADSGLTWDQSRNLTNSYSGGCDSVTGINGRCQSDHWPSMARFGRQNQGGENWTGAVVSDPSGGDYTGDY